VSRAITVPEANGRASIYLAALSSTLIALAFIEQMSRLGATVTFVRLVQSSIRTSEGTRLRPLVAPRRVHDGAAR
jgi:hypothetical protein